MGPIDNSFREILFWATSTEQKNIASQPPQYGAHYANPAVTRHDHVCWERHLGMSPNTHVMENVAINGKMKTLCQHFVLNGGWWVDTAVVSTAVSEVNSAPLDGIEIVGNRWPAMTTIDLKWKIDNHGLIWLIDNQVATRMCFSHWNGRDDCYSNSTFLAKIEPSWPSMAPWQPGEELYNSKEYRLRVKFRENAEVPFLPRVCLIWNVCWQVFFFRWAMAAVWSVKRFVFVDQTSSDKWIATGIMSWLLKHDSQVPSGKLT